MGNGLLFPQKLRACGWRVKCRWPPSHLPGIAGAGIPARRREGDVLALDAATGALLWQKTVGGMIAAAPITWMIDGEQYVLIAAGGALFTFGLR